MASPLAPSARPATAASPIAIEIRAVSRRFDQVVAVDDVSLAIRSGEFFSLLGPSGCGKTTLLRLIGGFEHADSGRILLLGEDVTALPPHLRRANTIFQHLALFPHMNVFDNIAFGLRMKHLDATAIARKVNEALSLVSLEGYGRRRIDQLSGGQKQRIAIARALVNEPAVLLLDEPLGALDLKLRLQMQDELRRIQRSLGSPFIFVTHDQGEAMAMSDRIAVMQNGRILQTGTPAEIYERPRSLFVAQFVGHANLLRGRIAEARGAGRYCVEAEGLRIPCLSSQTLAPGTAVTLSLRHEKVAILDSDAVDDQIVFDGVITVKTYLGATLRFEVRLDTGAALTAELPNTPRSTAIAVGDGARIGWSVESPHLLTE